MSSIWRRRLRAIFLLECFLALAFAPSSLGCACNQKTLHATLVGVYYGVNMTDTLAVPALHTACVAEGKACVKKGVTEKAKCMKLVECQKLYDVIVASIKTGRTTLGELDEAIKKAAAMGWLKLGLTTAD